jgi:hypothetical protein
MGCIKMTLFWDLNVVWSGRSLPTFHWCLQPPSSERFAYHYYTVSLFYSVASDERYLSIVTIPCVLNSEENLSPKTSFEPVTPKYEAGVLTTKQRRVVAYNRYTN